MLNSPKTTLITATIIRIICDNGINNDHYLILSLSGQITPGSKAAVANLCPGDVILAIEGIPAEDMMHCEAQNKIKDAIYQLILTVQRSGVTLWGSHYSHAHTGIHTRISAVSRKHIHTHTYMYANTHAPLT